HRVTVADGDCAHRETSNAPGLEGEGATVDFRRHGLDLSLNIFRYGHRFLQWTCAEHDSPSCGRAIVPEDRGTGAERRNPSPRSNTSTLPGNKHERLTVCQRTLQSVPCRQSQQRREPMVPGVECTAREYGVRQ